MPRIIPTSHHSAKITINYEGFSFQFAILGYGSPECMRSFIRKAMRGRKAVIVTSPDEFLFNMLYVVGKATKRIMYRNPDHYRVGWKYRLNLGIEPEIRIESNISGIREIHNLFRWIGQFRKRVVKIAPPLTLTPTRRRGRPSLVESKGGVRLLRGGEGPDEIIHGVPHKDGKPYDPPSNIVHLTPEQKASTARAIKKLRGTKDE
jgi:hypothetical protein